MRPLFAIGPAALMRLFQEELLVRVDAVVHETGKLVLDFLELVVGDRLRDGGEAAPAACRGRQPCVRQPCGRAQEGHALYACQALFSAAGRPHVSEWMQRRVKRAYGTRGAARGELAAALQRELVAEASLVLAAIDGEFREGGLEAS